MSASASLDSHDQRARQAVREAMIVALADREMAERDLLDEMMAGRVAVRSVVTGLMTLAEHLTELLKSDGVTNADLEAVIRSALDG
jgi:hypothetical protein